MLSTIERWKEVDPGAASDEELLRGIRELGIAEGDYWSNDTSHTFGVAKSTDDQLQCFLRETLPDHHFTSGQFLSGFKSKTMEATEAMYGISKLIQANESLYELVLTTPAQRLMGELESHPESGAVLDAIDDYLATYGHQGYTLDFVEPPQIEDPTALLRHPQDHGGQPGLQLRSSTRSRLPGSARRPWRKIEELLEGLHYWQFRYRHWFTHRFYYIREECMSYLGSAWPTLRRLVAELGQRLVETGTFLLPDDVYYCTTAELTEAIDARREGKALPEMGQRAAERRELREARKRLHPPGYGSTRSEPDLRDPIQGDPGGQRPLERHVEGSSGQPRHGHRPGERDPLPGRVRSDEARLDPGLHHDQSGLDAALRARNRPGHRHRRHPRSRLDRRPGVRNSGSGRHRHRDPTPEERSGDSGRR